jgi:hypothetical protein
VLWLSHCAVQEAATDATTSLVIPQDTAKANAVLTAAANIPAEFAWQSSASGALQVPLTQDGTATAESMERALTMLTTKLKSRDHMLVAAGVFSRAQETHRKAASPEEASVASLCMDWCATVLPGCQFTDRADASQTT